LRAWARLLSRHGHTTGPGAGVPGEAGPVSRAMLSGAIRAIRPQEFVLNLVSMVVYPFAARPLVMAIMGGAVLPKLMGHIADEYSMSSGYIVPMGCFVIIALYGFLWPKLSGAESLSGVKTSGGH
jgi:hypothetical protein